MGPHRFGRSFETAQQSPVILDAMANARSITTDENSDERYCEARLGNRSAPHRPPITLSHGDKCPIEVFKERHHHPSAAAKHLT